MKVEINTEYITLGQLLKLADLVSSGGETKVYLAQVDVFVNGAPEDRRGRKLYPGDKVRTSGKEILVVRQESV